MSRLGLPRLARVTDLDVGGLPIYVGMSPSGRGLSVSKGKGLSNAAAKASALMESIEFWHGERVEAPMRYESYLAMRERVPVVDISRLLVRKGVVLRLDVPLLWVEGWDLLQWQRVWVPFGTVGSNFVRSAQSAPSFILCRTGSASGNH